MSASFYFDTTPGLNVVRGRSVVTRRENTSGYFTLTLTPYERRYVRSALASRAPALFVRDAVCAAAGLPAPSGASGNDSLPPRRLAFRLTQDELAFVRTLLLDRELIPWIRDAVRVAAGVRNNPWSPCADNVVRKHFRRTGLPEILRALPGRCATTVYQRAMNLGCTTALGDERLTVHRAAVAAGYDDKAFRRILAAAGVTPRELVGPVLHSDRRPHFVTRSEVRRAVDARTATETVAEACARLGRGHPALTNALHRLGYTKPADSRVWRLPSDVMDRAAAEIRGEGETLAEAHRRTRVSICALTAWLRDAGLLDRAAQYHRLDPAAVDRVVAERSSRRRSCRRCGEPGHYRSTCPRPA